jgi:excinuclease ABC subunit C
MTNLKKILLTPEQKEVLELLTGKKIMLRNTFVQSSDAIEKLLEQGKQNSLEYLNRKKLGHKLDLYEENNLHSGMLDIQKKLGLAKFPRRIECFDISHLAGTFVYGSMVVFIDGKPTKKYYRLFKCKEQNNDFQNLFEVLERRFKRALEEVKVGGEKWSLPDLIIIDGGKGQLSSVEKAWLHFKEVFSQQKVEFSTEICSLAKGEERVFLPFEKDIELAANGVLFENYAKFLIQRIRDETHRFGITNNRKARLKLANKTKLTDIDGVGDVTAKKLLVEFGSVENLVNNLWENQQFVLEMVGESTVSKLKEYFNVT